jgi:hypothetical protein
MNRRQQRKSRALGVLEYWNDGRMGKWNVGKVDEWNDAPKVPLFHYSSLPLFYSAFSPFAPVE